VRNAVIIAFVAFNVGMPLSYYVGDQPFDERFAWRMFSPVRIVRCQVAMYDASGQQLRLSKQMHVVWVNLLKRARLQVLDAYAAKYCGDETAGGRPAELYARLTCPPANGPDLGICRKGPRDSDGDGIPDGFVDARECGALSPADCFAEKCGGDDANTCFQKTCQQTVVDRAQNLCTEGVR
jgi:hypothetical protein